MYSVRVVMRLGRSCFCFQKKKKKPYLTYGRFSARYLPLSCHPMQSPYQSPISPNCLFSKRLPFQPWSWECRHFLFTTMLSNRPSLPFFPLNICSFLLLTMMNNDWSKGGHKSFVFHVQFVSLSNDSQRCGWSFIVDRITAIICGVYQASAD